MADQDLNVQYVANLARLDLTDEEAARYQKQLGGILEHVRKLEALDLDGIEPTAHGQAVSNVIRADVPHGKSLSQEDALSNAPRQSNGQFVVPKVLD